MAGKKGMTVKKNREDSPKFAEYFKLKGDLRSLMKSDINKLLKASTIED